MASYAEKTETLEDLGRAGFSLIQSKDGFRFGEDTVLLSWFVSENLRIRKAHPVRVLELGTNCGAGSVLLAARRKDIRIDGVERQKKAADIFLRNIELNGLSDRVRGFLKDLREIPDRQIPGNVYDAVFMNPPYRKAEEGPVTSEKIHSKELQEARFAMHGSVEDFLFCSKKMLASAGDLFLVDRSKDFSQVMKTCMELNLVPKKVTFVHPFSDREATLFLLSAKKGGKMTGTVITPPLILREKDGTYTETLKKIYNEEN
ncbi:MAG: methyltransferase [Clostridiales bacterium]|nr:methyltransferase [Clostridiales bacterium]